jgi:hypothetical protein
MKQVLLIFTTIMFLFSCRKKVETPDFSTLVVGKWVCNSYKKDDADTIVIHKPYSLSGFYENAWAFSTNKQVQYRSGTGVWFSFKKDTYSIVENKALTINSETVNADFSTYNFKIIELTTNKLTVYSELWKTTFFLIRE